MHKRICIMSVIMHNKSFISTFYDSLCQVSHTFKLTYLCTKKCTTNHIILMNCMNFTEYFIHSEKISHYNVIFREYSPL